MRKAPRKVVFSEFYIKNLNPGPAPYLRWDAKQAGFAVRVEPSGYKAWKAIYKFGGRKRDYHIDAVAKIGIADARKLASRIMFQVAEGTDPQAIKRAARSAGTFDDIADRYLEFAKRKNKSWRQADSLVQKHLRPKWGKLPAANISRSDVKAMMARIKAPIVANQTLAAASAIYSFAIKEELGAVKVNPCHGVERNATQTRERVLSATEIPLFWKAFDEAGVQGAALKVLLLLGQRPGETASMRSEHIVDGWWELSGEPVPAARLARNEKCTEPSRLDLGSSPRHHCCNSGPKVSYSPDRAAVPSMTLTSLCARYARSSASSALRLTICVERTARSSRRSVSDARP